MSKAKRLTTRQLNSLVRLGVLECTKLHGKNYYKDSKLSQEIDRMNPRRSFLLGVKKGIVLCHKRDRRGRFC